MKHDIQAIEKALAKANAANEAFKVQLVRQFGADHAAELRYKRTAWDSKTMKANEAYLAATDALRQAMRPEPN